jgi:hypothetical protein
VHKSAENSKEIVNNDKSSNNRRGKHSKRISLSSCELKQCINVPNDDTNTNTNIHNFITEESQAEYDLTNKLLTTNNQSLLNVSEYNFEDVFSYDEDKEVFKQIGRQRLDYLIQEMESESTDQISTTDVGKSINKTKGTRTTRSYTPRKHNHNEICKKFKENPSRFFTEKVTDEMLKRRYNMKRVVDEINLSEIKSQTKRKGK